MVIADVPTVGTVLVTAIIDSINPCAIGVLILLVSTILSSVKSRGKMLKVGITYITAVYAAYFLAGLGLTLGLSFIPISLATYISIAVASFVIILGVIEIKDFFWYGKGFSLMISPDMAKRITQYVNNISGPGIIFLGVFVALVELPCTGGPYLAITLLLSQSFNLTALLLLMLYNFIFVLPLLIILVLVYAGVTKVHTVKKWKQNNRAFMRLLTGLLLLYLGWVLMLIANTTINLI